MDSDRASFDDLYDDALQPDEQGVAPSEHEESDHLPMIDQLDVEILMHRDAHFNGRWDVMLEYYRKEGRGIQHDFEIDHLEYLAKTEEGLGKNLAGLFLQGPDAEMVGEARDAYRKLRDLYDDESTEGSPARLIADLILSEDEDPFLEVTAIVEEGPIMIPLLSELLASETMADPLFPGYGQAPLLAARCLGAIQDERAIIPLFEAIGRRDFSHEAAAIAGLHGIGVPAKTFLFTVLENRPLTQDNERAAVALAAFSEEEDVQKAAADQLSDPDVQAITSLRESLELIRD